MDREERGDPWGEGRKKGVEEEATTDSFRRRTAAIVI